MITFIIFIILSFLLYYKSTWIKKHNTSLYTFFIILSLIAFLISQLATHTIFNSLTLPWIKGFLGLALFYMVMLAGALPNWTYQKKLYSVRTELSIIGFIAISPHAIFNLVKIIKGTIEPTYFGIIAYIIMIPLFITSFISIRKKMKPKDWKKLQRLAYIVYILLFIHLIIHYSLPINQILYIVLLVNYLIFKLIKIFKNSKR
ncbi:hypothetical protein HF295_03385 [Hujiaoplasma nucleasis]|uniref:Ferric oxidoreductase domain-containing protein n=1 Tax=Hujiaoplasma nucleasis TaxID=2725268 RepID=A0A7L6N5V5_9MOLU|nr:ferric reductase-like transmembrane domain-containing protein [Hujiaoplasma nucleasis]QLY39949.1 hypothetical protein HF295_03385 [Hujiaoplasma nucleasis]